MDTSQSMSSHALPSTHRHAGSDDSPDRNKHHDRGRIGIIGAGPAGLAMVKTLREMSQFQEGSWNITVFEARESLGGIWLPAPASVLNNSYLPVTPLYDNLTTNLPHPIMAYKSFPFPPSTPLFPPASSVLDYLSAYARTFGLTQHIRFDSYVRDVARDVVNHTWKLEVEHPSSGPKTTVSEFDFLIIANGHFNVPRYPNLPGLSDWLHCGKAIHAAWYRNPASVPGTGPVLVVGGGPSGIDIAKELSSHPPSSSAAVHAETENRSNRTVVHAFPNSRPTQVNAALTLHVRPRVTAFGDPASGVVYFEDGTSLSGIDRTVLCTGYQYSYTFFHLNTSVVRHSPSPSTLTGCSPQALPDALHNSTYHIFPLAMHLFPVIRPTTENNDSINTSIAFLGLTLRGVPLSLFETQAQAVARILADPDALSVESATADVRMRQTQLRGESGDELQVAREWYRLTEAESFSYRDALDAFAGIHTKVEDWEREAWDAKVEMRAEWERLEKEGLADQWLENIGEGTLTDWIKLMKRVLGRAEERRRGQRSEHKERIALL